MDKIYIGFSRPKNEKLAITSWLIMLFDNSSFSHVYLGWHSDSLDRDIIYQASDGMVHFVGKKRFETDLKEVHKFEIECLEEKKKELMQFAVDNAEVPYGFKQLIGIVLARVLSVFGIKFKKNPISSGKNEEICSEIGGRALQILGFNIDKDIDMLTPKDIFNILSNNIKAIQLF